MSLFFVAAICLVMGAVLGWFVASMFGGKADGSAGAENKAGPGTTTVAFLKLSRQVEKGPLAVEVKGKVQADAKSLNPEELIQLAELLNEAGRWAGIGANPSPAEVPAIKLPTGQATDSPERRSSPGVVPDAGPVLELEASRPRVLDGMTNALANVINPTSSRKEDPKSIVQQIDEILQDKLLLTDLAEQKIGLLEDPRKGVVVRIGAETFEGINSVPDGLVKELLKASVQDWEKRQEISKRRNSL